MYYHIRHSLTDGPEYRSVVLSRHAVHDKWALKICRQLTHNFVEEIIKVILPSSIVCQPVTPPLAFGEMSLVNIVHPDIVKTLSDRQAFAKHEQSRQRQPFLLVFSVDGVSPKTFQKLFVVKSVKRMYWIPDSEFVSVSLQRRHVDIVHRVVFYQESVAPLLVCIANHGPHFALITMIVALVCPLESSFDGIAVDIYGPLAIVGRRYVNYHNILAIDINREHVLVF